MDISLYYLNYSDPKFYIPFSPTIQYSLKVDQMLLTKPIHGLYKTTLNSGVT